ncbi:CLUMA_CG010656, isoform A [Clunio marinus]|uniref:CLUMA_CG010656, isoform A n=1 Tax=Clunio marinus TaxID=568069 RepID=A0A1J1IAM2_9DIPT|nr:CLUMA_CG010656, isoform A [Clunio marinus]
MLTELGETKLNENAVAVRVNKYPNSGSQAITSIEQPKKKSDNKCALKKRIKTETKNIINKKREFKYSSLSSDKTVKFINL